MTERSNMLSARLIAHKQLNSKFFDNPFAICLLPVTKHLQYTLAPSKTATRTFVLKYDIKCVLSYSTVHNREIASCCQNKSACATCVKLA